MSVKQRWVKRSPKRARVCSTREMSVRSLPRPMIMVRPLRRGWWGPPPPILPHKGGGALRWLGRDGATDLIGHPPPRGEGWGGGGRRRRPSRQPPRAGFHRGNGGQFRGQRVGGIGGDPVTGER